MTPKSAITSAYGSSSACEPAAAALDRAVAIPEYLRRTYRWAYLDPRTLRVLDREIVVNAILWGNYQRLVRAACAEFRPGEHVLQAASVYGSQQAGLATQRDCAARRRFGARLPDPRCRVLLLSVTRDAGQVQTPRRGRTARLREARRKVVFVDYASPRWFHPLRGLMALVNCCLEPYAASLWRRPIASFANEAASFSWTERRLFLGLYQIVVARRRDHGHGTGRR